MTDFKNLITQMVNPLSHKDHGLLVKKLVNHYNSIIGEKKLESLVGSSKETPLNCGIAISPRDAANGVLESLKTVKLIAAVYSVLKKASEENQNPGPLRVLYAGCGPLAPAILGAATLISPEKVRFVLMDIHRESVEAAEQILSGLGLGDAIEECITADATTYRHHQKYPIDGLITFAINKGLDREPQLGIMLNLVPQLSGPEIIIPEAVDFWAYIVNPEKELSEHSESGDKKKFKFNRSKASDSRVNLGPLFRLSRKNIKEIGNSVKAVGFDRAVKLELAKFPVPELKDDTCKTLMITTIIHLGDGICLNEYESPLTYPSFMMTGDGIEGAKMLDFSYLVSSFPRFIHASVR